MLIAGEASGDTLAAELVPELRAQLSCAESFYTADPQPLKSGLEPRFFGAGGPRMAEAGVELAFDLTRHSVVGITDVLKHYLKFRRLFGQLLRLAVERQPDAIIGVDYGGFNLRFAHAIRRYLRSRHGWFHTWRPKIVQYVSPQVWASRAGRAFQMQRDHDLVLSIFPFEKVWYARRAPKLRVEFVGHPMLDRMRNAGGRWPSKVASAAAPTVLLLPGSRSEELRRHLPVMLGALALLRVKVPARAELALPNQDLAAQAKSLGVPTDVDIQAGGLPGALARADLAIASTGTVTMECAWFGVPTVTLYRTSWSNYQIARSIVTVKWLTMPNLLAHEEVFPEFVQGAATAENISRAALELLQDESRRGQLRMKLAQLVASLGGPGASARAARSVVRLLGGLA